MVMKNYQLVVRSGPTPGKIFPIMKTEVIIGRDPSAEILINDAEVSRHHAVIKLQAEGYVVEDLGSTNGTIVNGERLAGPHLLRAGEIISLGEHLSLVFEPQPILDPDATIVAARMNLQSAPAASQPSAPPRMEPAPIPAKPYVPVTPPADDYSFPEEMLPDGTPAAPNKPKFPIWLIILLVSMVIITCICVSVLWVIDVNDQWCNFFPFLAGCQ